MHSKYDGRGRKKAREYFEETKDILQLFCPYVWMDKFQEHIEEFVQQHHLSAAEIITAVPLMAEEDYVHLHGLCHLIIIGTALDM
ncbi:hypothetical protein V8E53_014435 [Lactarius tabidus]